MNQYNAINSNPTTGSATVLEPIVNVYVLEGQTADVTRNDDGSLDVRIRQIAGEVAEKVFLQGIQNLIVESARHSSKTTMQHLDGNN